MHSYIQITDENAQLISYMLLWNISGVRLHIGKYILWQNGMPGEVPWTTCSSVKLPAIAVDEAYLADYLA